MQLTDTSTTVSARIGQLHASDVVEVSGGYGKDSPSRTRIGYLTASNVDVQCRLPPTLHCTLTIGAVVYQKRDSRRNVQVSFVADAPAGSGAIRLDHPSAAEQNHQPSDRVV